MTLDEPQTVQKTSGVSRKRPFRTMSQPDVTPPVERGYFSLPGRKQEDRIVGGVKLLIKNGKYVEADIVIDGHGGADVCVFLVDNLPKALKRLCLLHYLELDTDLENETAWTAVLKEAFAECNHAWDMHEKMSGAQLKSGAVATLVLYGHKYGMVAHVGDGKAVLHTTTGVSELTVSHRADEPSERSRIEELGGCVCNNRVRGVLAPSRAFGDILIRTDRFGRVNDDIIKPEPQIVRFSVKEPGCMVVGTDGLFDVFPVEVVARTTQLFLDRVADNTLAARFLAEQASLRSDDDISVVVANWGQ